MENYLKRLSVLVLMLISFTCIAQVEEINNVNTSGHYNIKGTRYSLKLPNETYLETTDYTGLKSNKYETGINFTEVPMPFEEVLDMFMKDLPPKNGELLVDEDYKINGFSTKLFKSNTTTDVFEGSFQDVAISKKNTTWVLLFGNKEFSLIIVSTYKTSLDNVLSDITKQSLLSFFYNENIEIDPLNQLSFSLDITKTQLKFATIFMQTGVAFTLDGNFPTKSNNKVGYIVMVMPIPVEEGKWEARAVKNCIGNKNNLEIKEKNKISISNLGGYEIISFDKETNNLSYGVTLFDSEKQYVIIGKSDVDTDKYLKEFKSLTASFKLK